MAESAFCLEKMRIVYLKACNVLLTNKSIGGVGPQGVKRPDLSKRNKEKIWTLEERLEASKKSKGHKNNLGKKRPDLSERNRLRSKRNSYATDGAYE
jgi:hypothetical protein